LRCFCAFCAKQNSAEQFKIAQKTRKTSKILCLRAKQRKIFAQILRIFRKAAQKFCTDFAHFPLNTANLLRRFSVFFKELWIEFYFKK
jgi:hypothetical protein